MLMALHRCIVHALFMLALSWPDRSGNARQNIRHSVLHAARSGSHRAFGGACCNIMHAPSKLLQFDEHDCSPVLGCRASRAPSDQEAVQVP